MKKFSQKILTVFLLGAFALGASARFHQPYTGSRIYWDMGSKQMIFPSGTYARIIQLSDGRLLAVGESGGGISVNWSSDEGKSWAGPQLVVPNAPRVPYAVPDVIQLADGEIIIGFNPRPSAPYDESRKFGIRCVRSTDNGATWSAPIYIYDASHLGSEGCWEPCFLELPSGELQCYFANENNFPYSGEQEISMSRSYDKGLSWQPPVRVCFSNGSRDGMPVPILTDDNEIVVIIEDNGWGGYNGFRATVVRSTLENNWTDWAGRDRRSMVFANNEDKAFVSAAPYIRRLGSDETVVSWQGDRGERIGKGESYFEMSVGVGDANGTNVKAISSPFALPLTQHGLWNSVTALDNGSVFAVSSIGEPGKGEVIYAMTGYALKGFEAAYGTPEINGTPVNETWTKEKASQVFLGCNVTKNAAVADFLYDDEYLYFYADVKDSKIVADSEENDGITLAIDVNNASDSYPQEGMHRFFLDCDGTVGYMYGRSNKWNVAEASDLVRYSVSIRRTGYSLEAAIPWSVLGRESAPVDGIMRCYIDIRDSKTGGSVCETIPEADIEKSWTWPELRLKPADSEGFKDILSDNNGFGNDIEITCNDGIITLNSPAELSEISVYSLTGRVIYTQKCASCTPSIDVSGNKGVCIVEARDSEKRSKRFKLAIL